MASINSTTCSNSYTSWVVFLVIRKGQEMKIEKLNNTQLFLAGQLMTKISEEIKNGIVDGADEDITKAIGYILTKFDGINKEIAEKICAELIVGMKEAQKLMNEE